MKSLRISIKSAGINVPLSRKKTFELVGIPHSSSRALLYVLSGLRPPSQYHNGKSDFEPILERLANNATYNFTSMVKQEVYFGRRAEYKQSSAGVVCEEYAILACGKEFVEALETVFKGGSFRINFGLFRDAIFSRSNRDEPVPEQLLAMKELEIQFVANTGAKKNCWKISGSYIDPRNYYEKAWIMRTTPFGGAKPLGVIGGPKIKMTFDAHLFFHFEDEETKLYLLKKLSQGPGHGTFCEGGFAYIDQPDDLTELFSHSRKPLGEHIPVTSDPTRPRSPNK